MWKIKDGSIKKGVAMPISFSAVANTAVAALYRETEYPGL